MYPKTSKTITGKNIWAKKSPLLGSVLYHVVLLLVMTICIGQYPKECPKELPLTLVKLVKLDSIKSSNKPAKKTTDQNEPLLDNVKRKQFTKKMSSLTKVQLTNPVGIEPSQRVFAQRRVRFDMQTPDYQTVTDSKEIVISYAPQANNSLIVKEVLPVFPLSSRQSQVAFARNIESIPVIKHTDNSFASDDELLNYQNTIKELISTRKIYPWIARKKGIEGMVLVSFLILRDGQLKDIKLITSSHYQILDQAAIKTINSAAPFSPLPKKANKSELWVKVALSFSLE